jgi:hypothetical protein
LDRNKSRYGTSDAGFENDHENNSEKNSQQKTEILNNMDTTGRFLYLEIACGITLITEHK